ncbi:MAG: hypothetical protein ACRDP9_04745 [Kribbellaceae bacterium]|jgi:hypothetical protein|nr:hypothetical protein [Kribbellaceae bacterium]
MAGKRHVMVTRDQVEIAKLAVEAAKKAGRKPNAVAEKVARAETNGG